MADITTPFDPTTVRTADDVAAVAARIFGALPAARGVLHSSAVADRGDGMLLALPVGGDAPRPPEDRLVLGLGRARADAVLITGAVLRAEPGLRHAPDPTDPMTAALTAWRHRGGRRRPFTSVIMTRSRDIDLDHPLFGDGRPFIVFTGDDAPARFAIEVAARGGLVMTDAEPGLRRCLARLAQAGHSAVTVEAGPSLARRLYRTPLAVDETLLTVLEPDPPSLDGTAGSLLPEAELAERLRRAGSGYRTRTGAGEWRFERYCR